MADSTIDTMLAQRGARYGDFIKVAETAQGIKRVLRNGATWEDTSRPQREAMEMIANKLARIVNGDATYRDSWIDIMGYVQLALETMPE